MSATIELLTYADLIDHLVDYTAANPSAEKVRQAKRAIQQGYSGFRNDHQWPYYNTVGRVSTDAPFDEGTIEFDLTGGGIERELTLTGDEEWPTWAAYGAILIDSVFYEVAERVSGTVLQLDINRSPLSDVDSGTTFQLIRDIYTLPSDFVNMHEPYTPNNWERLDYVHPSDWLIKHRFNTSSASTPSSYTIIGSPDFMGAMAIGFYPFPDAEETIDFVYQRQARPLKVERVLGIGSADEGDSYINYTSGSLFTQEMVGSVIRVSESSGANYPDGRTGTNPFDEERVIMEVNDTGTQATVDQEWIRAHSNAKYTISDPVDIEPGIMTRGLLRCCEMEMAIICRMQDRQDAINTYMMFLEKHKSYSQRSRQPRFVGDGGTGRRRLAYMPSGADVD